MANKVTFEDAVATLESMFPDWDTRDLEQMLLGNRNHVENTIDAIFQMDGPPRPKTNSSSARNGTAGPMGPPNRNQSTGKLPASNVYGETYRGIRVTLPPDFLRPPTGFVANQASFDDEQLAQLLQDEMFQREVAMSMGRQAPLQGPPGRARTASATGRMPYHGSPGSIPPPPSYSASPGSAATAANQASSTGDMKSKLASMGAAAKRNLNNLALSFSRRARQQPPAITAPNDGDTSSLMNYFEDKPEAEDEVITFEQRNPGAPVLPRGAPRHTLEEPTTPGSTMFRKTS